MPLSGTPNISFSFCWIKWFMTIINQFIRPIDQVNVCQWSLCCDFWYSHFAAWNLRFGHGAAIAEVREGATRALTRGTTTGIGHMYVETGHNGLELSMACSLNYGAICKDTCALTHTDIVWLNVKAQCTECTTTVCIIFCVLDHRDRHGFIQYV